MSLIDDALKRAQAAGEGEADRSKPGSRPWIPTPMPDAGLARRRALTRWLGIAAASAVVLAVVAIGLGWALRQATRAPAGGGSGEPRAVAVAPLPTPTLPAEETIVAPPAAAVTRVRPTRVPRPEQEGGAEAPATSDAPTPAARPQAIANGKNYVGSVNLPGGARIELGGIVWSETEPRALLNDRIVATGAYIEGFNVAKIEEGRVLLEKDGATISLSVK